MPSPKKDPFTAADRKALRTYTGPGYALRTRGVQLTAADAIAAARRVLGQGAPHM